MVVAPFATDSLIVAEKDTVAPKYLVRALLAGGS
jgi:hypothetical protein